MNSDGKRCGHGTLGFCQYCESDKLWRRLGNAPYSEVFVDTGAPSDVVVSGKPDWATTVRVDKPHALHEGHLAALERAIRAEGYRIMIEVGTDNITLVKD